MVLSIIFLEDKHKMLLHLSIFYEYQQFFQHRICFSIQPPDYSDPWPTLARSTSFFLNNVVFIVQRAYHSPNTLPTMIHGNALRIITWCPPMERAWPIRHPGVCWAALWVRVLRTFTSTQWQIWTFWLLTTSAT